MQHAHGAFLDASRMAIPPLLIVLHLWIWGTFGGNMDVSTFNKDNTYALEIGTNTIPLPHLNRWHTCHPMVDFIISRCFESLYWLPRLLKVTMRVEGAL